MTEIRKGREEGKVEELVEIQRDSVIVTPGRAGGQEREQ